MCHMCSWYHQRPEEGIETPGASDGCESPCQCWNQTYVPQKSSQGHLCTLIYFFYHSSNPWPWTVLNACVNQIPMPKKNIGKTQNSFSESPVMMTLQYWVINAKKQYIGIIPNAP